MTSNKIPLVPAIVASLGLAFVLAVVGYWVFEIMSLSWHTYGTPFDKYSTKYTTKKVDPRDTFICDPAYSTRWSACNVK